MQTISKKWSVVDAAKSSCAPPVKKARTTQVLTLEYVGEKTHVWKDLRVCADLFWAAAGWSDPSPLPAESEEKDRYQYIAQMMLKVIIQRGACLWPSSSGNTYSDSKGKQEDLLWYKDSAYHLLGEFSMAVVQANNLLEDQSQVESGPLTTLPFGPCGTVLVSMTVMAALRPHALSTIISSTISRNSQRSRVPCQWR